MHRCRKRGAIAPLIAVLLLVIVVSVAFVVDLGHVHNVKAELQRAVDAAALAGARQLPSAAKVDAVAIATASQNTVDQEAVVIPPEDVILGIWDTDNLAASPGDRFTVYTGSGPDPNAVYVRASRTVDHAFFFFIDASEVTADAIALSKPINPVMPLALVSCIPLDKILRDPTSLPNASACDIRYYIFDNDNDDSAAWTSLTLNVNANEMGKLLDKNDELSQLFEQIVFGLNLDNRGIENTLPKYPPAKCLLKTHNDGTTINCGLGPADGSLEDLVPPEDFIPPASINLTPVEMPRNTSGVYTPNTGFDPMDDYAENGALPRWYNLGDDTGKTAEQKRRLWTNDHFARLWTLDGILLKGEYEDPIAYLLRLKGYYTSTVGVPAPFNDGRLMPTAGGTDQLIKKGLSSDEEFALFAALYNLDPSNTKPIKDHIEAAKLAVSGSKTGPLYFPNFMEIIARSGYPEVGVTNGVISNLMTTFMSKDNVTDGVGNLRCSANEPLASDANANYGHTLRVQAPVIFTGFCESWKSLGLTNDNFNLYYIGLADFYLTRTWSNPDEYDCGSNFVYGGYCPQTFDPPLTSGEFRAIGVPAARAIEGLFQPPRLENADSGSVARVFLVE